MSNLDDKLKAICDYIYDVKHNKVHVANSMNKLSIQWELNYDDDEDDDGGFYHCTSIYIEFAIRSEQLDEQIILHDNYIYYQKEPFTIKTFKLPDFLLGIEKLEDYSNFLEEINKNKELQSISAKQEGVTIMPLYDKEIRDNIFNSEGFKKKLKEIEMKLEINAKAEKATMLKKIVSHPDFWKYALEHI